MKEMGTSRTLGQGGSVESTSLCLTGDFRRLVCSTGSVIFPTIWLSTIAFNRVTLWPFQDPAEGRCLIAQSSTLVRFFRHATLRVSCKQLNRGRLDDAWILLSDLAEQCLCEPGESFVPRSSDWTPSQPSLRNKTRKALCSPSVACLRKLYSRRSHYGNRPWDNALAHKIAASLSGVRRLVPELPFYSGEGLQHAAPAVKQLLLAYEKQERDSILYAWREKLRHEDHRIRSFVKNRSEQQLLYESLDRIRMAPGIQLLQFRPRPVLGPRNGMLSNVRTGQSFLAFFRGSVVHSTAKCP